MTTNFQKVTEFNAVLGQGVASEPSLPSFAQVHLRASLIEEEGVREFQAAVANRDLVEIADAIGDTLVVVYGAANDFGLDADKILPIIHVSNMSKLCLSEEEAKDTVKRYTEGYYGDAPVPAAYRPTNDGSGRFIVFNSQTGKTLKGPRFISPKAALTNLIYPMGAPAIINSPIKDKAMQMMKEGKISMSSYWDTCAIVDASQAPLAEVVE